VSQPGIARLAGLLADETRATFCLALLDGRGWTATELARHAGVAPSTASEHLSKLVDGGLLIEHRQGRHRYVSLAGPHVADLIEELTAMAPPGPPPRTLRAAAASDAMTRARTCYDHLAGRLGVALTDAMTTAKLLDQSTGFALTDDGLGWFDALGLSLARTGRPLVRGCLDWTERRTHLAGLAGARMCQYFFARGYLTRIGTGRAVRVTPAGRSAIADLLPVEPAVLA
jgi:DNA-binding transcriptional ArsR family regulator